MAHTQQEQSQKSKQIFEHDFEVLRTVQSEFFKVQAREKEGWELINVTVSSVDFNYVAIFKRPVQCKD